MQTLTDQNQINEWKNYMKEYEAQKKNIGYQAEVPKMHTHKEKKMKEYQFDTVNVLYRDPQKEAEAKHSDTVQIDNKRKAVKEFLDSKDQGFDIITLHEHKADLPPAVEKLAMSKRRILPKAQVTYNVVTNNDHPDTHWKGVEKPSPKKEYVKKVNTDIFRDFNIVSNKYWEGHDDKDKKDRAEIKQDLDDKYKKTHDFNYVTCSYYDQGKEDAFVQDRKEKQANHGKEYLNRLPPTLRMRETIVFDSSKAVPEEVKRFDEFKKNQKKRYEKRYEVEQELRDRDIELQDRNEDLALNRYRGEKYYEEKFKGFDNFTLSNTRDQIKSLEPHARNKPKLSLWEHIQHEAQEQLPERPGMATEALPPKVVNREVNVDEIPQYQRGELAPVQEKTQSQRPPTPEPEIPQYSQPPAQDQPFFNSQNLATSYPENNQFQQYSSQIPDLRGGNSVQGGSVRDSEKPSNGISQGLFQSNVMAAPLRLYQPELAKDAALYRQQEDDKKSTNTPSQYNRSRLISGQSNQSKLSFASQYSKGSGKLPSIGRSKPLEQGYEVPISFGKPKDKRSGSSSQAPVCETHDVDRGRIYPNAFLIQYQY